MPVNVFLEANPTRRRELQEHLTSKLGDWFGRPESNAMYASAAERLDGFVAESDGVRRGLLAFRQISSAGAEIHWIGVDPDAHRTGAGRALVEAVVAHCRSLGVRFLFVATLHPSVLYEPYQRTRLFYEAMGFQYALDEHVVDPENPIAYYLRVL